MRNRCLLSSLFLFPLILLLSCSTNNSTDFGANILRDKLPNEFRTYAMDASDVLGSLALPQLPADTGFGIHKVGGAWSVGTMVIGDSNGEHSGGFTRIAIPHDTFSSRFFDGGLQDTLRSLMVVVHRDSLRSPESLQVWRSGNIRHALRPSAGDSLLGTLGLGHQVRLDTVNAADTLQLGHLGPFAESIFRACTTSIRGVRQDSLSLIFVNPSGTIVRIHGNPQLVVGFKRGSNDTTRYCSYGVSGNRGADSSSAYYIAQRSASATDALPLAYASQRTLVYKFSTAGLWGTSAFGAFPDSAWNRSKVVSAFFSLQRPDAHPGDPNKPVDTLILQYLLSDKLIRSGIRLDTMFKRNQDPGAVMLIDTAESKADVGSSLESIKNTYHSLDTLYLYLRLAEDTRQIWKKASFNRAPVLKATIASH